MNGLLIICSVNSKSQCALLLIKCQLLATCGKAQYLYCLSAPSQTQASLWSQSHCCCHHCNCFLSDTTYNSSHPLFLRSILIMYFKLLFPVWQAFLLFYYALLNNLIVIVHICFSIVQIYAVLMFWNAAILMVQQGTAEADFSLLSISHTQDNWHAWLPKGQK